MGSNNWGVSSLRNYLRMSLTLWHNYTRRICNDKCVITGLPYDIIHHKHPFYKIFFEVFIETGIPYYDDENIERYSQDEIKQIKSKCSELHFKYGAGACLTNEVHNEFHDLYGFNVGIREFEEYAHSKQNNIMQLKEDIQKQMTARRIRKGKDKSREKINVIKVKNKDNKSDALKNYEQSLIAEFTGKTNGYIIKTHVFREKYNINERSFMNYNKKYIHIKKLLEELNVIKKGHNFYVIII